MQVFSSLSFEGFIVRWFGSMSMLLVFLSLAASTVQASDWHCL
jgi:hypothetical protein